MNETVTMTAVIGTIVIFALIIAVTSIFGRRFTELPERRAGRLGERFATTIISEILSSGDILLTNVPISFGGMQSELDNVVINENGVSIIEVKNYAGELFGGEDDPEWIMNGSGADMLNQHPVENPIEQVKRQMEILSRILNFNGIRASVKGYVFFVNMNSPVDSGYILGTRDDIDAAVHAVREERMEPGAAERIAKLLARK
ncbi:MAG: NERD domain-containing protein [Lachnospiraceae bacterium]|nr:NERD domain-containing protein [Lachnospiraceae bacterium]